MSEYVEAEDREERARRRKQAPAQLAANWTREKPSDRQLPFRVRLRLALYLLGLGKGRQ
jgi:hypothetical protein